MEADRGAQISVRVTGTADGYTPASATSPAVGPVLGALTPGTPTITGTPTFGKQLTAVGGAWAPAPLSLAYQWLRNEQPITNATAATHTLGLADVGARVSVRVTGSKAGYQSAAATSAQTATVAKATLTAPSVVTINDATPKVDQTLTVSAGTWGPAPVTLSYQWYRGTAAITGATKATYKVAAADLSQALKVRVTGSKAGHDSVSRTSAATSAVAKATFATIPPPMITGTARVDLSLTAVPGTWSPIPSSFGYQWYRNGTAISGATASKYQLTSASRGTVITVRVTGNRAGYITASKLSAGTVKVMAGLTAVPPTISDTTPTVDQTLTARTGTWGPAPVTFAYQWYRGTTAITGATAATYKVQPADAAQSLKVKVTGSKSGYASLSRTSAATTAVAKASFSTQPIPTISGTKLVGQLLTATPGTWTPKPDSLSYQWYRSGVAITGATQATCRLTTADKGKTLTVKVTARRAGYNTASKTSVATSAIG